MPEPQSSEGDDSVISPLSTIIYGLRPYPAIIGLVGQFPPHQPPGLHLLFWAWGVSGPPSHHHWPLANPFHYGGFGLNGLFGPFRPPTASTVRTDRGPRSA
ncbi:hypothetical protein O181_012213, partial [Austropuccinia psidii MF-1]|nr:hypothetical protein [Austropuccinia psidii MF-1]